MSHWTCRPIFDSFWLVFGLTGMLLLLLWVRPQFPGVTGRQRRTLAALRVLVIGLVLLAMLRPTLIHSETRSQSATIVVLLDASRSMGLPAASGDLTRWEAARKSLQSIRPLVDQLGGTYDFEFFLFDSEARTIQGLDDEAMPAKPLGDQSNIGWALEEVVAKQLGKHVAGVFLLSDGVQRSNTATVDLLQPARTLARRECPLWTIAYGQARDQSQARDVAIENLPDEYTVFTHNELQIEASLRIQGYAGKPVPVELRVETPDGSTERVGPISLFAENPDQQLRVRLAYTPSEPGAYRLTVRTPPQPGEQVTQNNELTAFATVLEGGIRVLYVDGNVAWQERKFIRRSLDASPDIAVDVALDMRTLRDSAMDFPDDQTLAGYDVFLIGDIGAIALGDENGAKIVKAVGEGKGLMTLGGVNAYGPGGYALSSLATVLPIEMDRLERQSHGEPIRTDVHHAEELQMMPNPQHAGEHVVLRLASGPNNLVRWQSLMPLSGANRFRKLGDQAQVLAWGSRKGGEDVPLLISGRYGLGRVLVFAGDSTYRWYRYGHEEEHRRFWRQAMLWLARKDAQGKNQVMLRLAQRRYRRGVRVPVTVVAKDELGDVITDLDLDVRLKRPDGQVVGVRVTESDQGEFTGSSEIVNDPGEYQFQVVATRNGEAFGEAVREFQILDQDLELVDAAANPGQLRAMAMVTSEWGGRLLAAEELPEVLQRLAEKEVTSELEFESQWQLADSSIDAGTLLLLIAALLIAEWFLRKHWGWV